MKKHKAIKNQQFTPLDSPKESIFQIHNRVVKQFGCFTKELKLGNITISYVSNIQGIDTKSDVILFIHGLGNNCKVWLKVMKKVPLHCVAIDLPNHGLSSPIPKLSFPSLVQYVKLFISELEPKSLRIVGHSMDAHLSSYLYSMTNSLCFLAPSGFEFFSKKEQVWLTQLYSPWMIKKYIKENVELIVMRNFNTFSQDARYMIEEIHSLAASQSLESYCSTLAICLRDVLNFPFHKAANRPGTKVFYGKNDAIIPHKILHNHLTYKDIDSEISSSLGSASIELISNCGHMIQWEQAEKLSLYLCKTDNSNL